MHRVRRQRAVVDPPGVRGAHRLGKLPHQSEASSQVQTVPVLDQVVVQAQRLRVVVEEDRGPGGMPRRQIVLQLHRARMTKPAQYRCLAGGGSLHRAPLVVGGATFAEEDSYPCQIVQLGMAAQIVGPGEPGVERLRLQEVGAHLVLAADRCDTEFLQGRIDKAGRRGCGLVPGVSRRYGQRLHELFDREHAVHIGGRKVHPKLVVGEADRFTHPDLRPVRRPTGDTVDQARQLLGLPVRQVQRVAVPTAGPTRRGLHPVVATTVDRAVPILELDQEHSGRRHDQKVDLTDVPAVRGEREVRPGAPRLLVRQTPANRLKTAALVLILGLGDRSPPAFQHAAPRLCLLVRVCACGVPVSASGSVAQPPDES